MSEKLLSREHGVKVGRFALFFGCLMLIVLWLFFLHLTVNVTASMPIGIYRLHALDRPVMRGDIVQVCPPAQAAKYISTKEGNKFRGTCIYQTAPLLKFVAAVGGDVVDLRDNRVVVNGITLPGSATLPSPEGSFPAPRVTRGRYVLGADQLWLWTPYYRSLDSRYFGPVKISGVRWLAWPIFTGGRWADWREGLRSLADISLRSKKN